MPLHVACAEFVAHLSYHTVLSIEESLMSLIPIVKLIQQLFLVLKEFIFNLFYSLLLCCLILIESNSLGFVLLYIRILDLFELLNHLELLEVRIGLGTFDLNFVVYDLVKGLMMVDGR
jgi:hypothetical protein